MRIIISPAKKMKEDVDGLAWRDLPGFLGKTEEICKTLQGMSYDQLKRLWKCNDKIAALNYERLQSMDLRRNLTPAILAYEGIQYQYMAPSVFTDDEFDYACRHLRILSGFYGVLRPFDGVVPYRLEMQTRLSIGGAKDLYAFWGDSLTTDLCRDTEYIINLASKEYSAAVSAHLPLHIRLITCVFGEAQGSRVIEKGTMCKMARGEMVRYMAENQIETPEDIKEFDRLNYRFAEGRSDDRCYVFIRE